MASSEHEEAEARLLPQLGMMTRALLASPVGRTLILLATGLLVVIVATAYGQIRLNRWNRPFYDALSRRDFFAFLYQLGAFCLIAGSLLILNVAQTWHTQMLTLKLREGIVRDLLHDWMTPRRALLLANSGAIGVNPDQRMHEDTRRLCELSAELGGGLLQSSILLISFIGVLWVLSRGFALHLAGRDYPIPGYMVWAAFLYAGVASLLSWRVGRTLIPRNAERYAQEAELRFSLVRVNEHLDGISLAHGEAGETRRVELHLGAVLQAMRRLVTGLTNLTWVTAGYGWFTLVAPIIAASPLYFTGSVSFGGLMMAAGAFNQVQSSLRWFVDNFSVIADWRAILLRVASFRRALATADRIAPEESRIEYAEGEPGALLLENLEIASASGHDALDAVRVEVRAGERLLIVADPGTARAQLFRALAGLWPWGSGRITRPGGERILYLPRGTPYLPRGTLREVLAYPDRAESFPAPACTQALRRLGLERLVPMLDQSHRWDRELTQEEQVNLAFARVVLQRPPWLVVDGAFGSLDGETLGRVIDLFTGELRHCSVIHIGNAAARDPLFERVTHLMKVRGPRRLLHPVALLALLVLAWPGLSPAAASDQSFQFQAPQALNEARTTMLMRDLAIRMLPVYSDPQRERYLANLSVLQMVAGDYGAAYAARQMLRQRLGGANPAQSGEQSVAYDIYAHTKALEAQSHLPFGRAFAQSFNAVVPRLDPLTDYAVTTWMSTPLPVFQGALQDTLLRLRGRRALSMSEALALMRAYLAYQIHLNTGPQADELIDEDDQARYVIQDDVPIHTAHGVTLAAMLVRPRNPAGPLPTLLEFTIYTYADNDARECAAHGYVGVVAYTRGKNVTPGTVRPYTVRPYEYDGEDARDVIAWIARQPWSDGRVGMYGSGYSGFTPWAAARQPAPALKAIAVTSPVAPGIDTPDRGSIFLNSAYRWARYVTGTPTLNDAAYDDETHWRQLNQEWYRSGRPYLDLPRIDGTPNPAFLRWLEHPGYDRYWQHMIPYGTEFAHVHVPVLMISGYYDENQAGALYYFSEHQHFAPRADDTLLLGPYDAQGTQGMPAAVLGGYRVDSGALFDLHALRFQWFDAIFHGTARPSILQPGVDFEVAGANQWRHAASLQTMAGGPVRFYLDPALSDAQPTGDDHRLSTRPAAAGAFVAQTVDFRDRSDAGWTAPGELLLTAPPTHYSQVYVSAPLREATEFDGVLAGELDVSVNQRDIDLTLTLYERLPGGGYLQLFEPPDEFRVSYLGDRSRRQLLRRGVRQALRFHGARLVSRRLQPGSRLVLVIGVNKRPDQELDYGTGAIVARESIAAVRVPLKLRWYGTSYIELPMQRPAGAVPRAPAPRPPAPRPPAPRSPPRPTAQR